ncbi:hypothetical protein L9F63_010922 [Diploptera punctata]|uniref:Ionotropic glutamate receptor C-terminal domain-containing protein n=1 Tax=Diploptera punctata TaxID=6984 RepID=A0AAD8AG01_DIPPU|nr:hypothetical protein L9F63_010922 [Diploptera punctata]
MYVYIRLNLNLCVLFYILIPVFCKLHVNLANCLQEIAHRHLYQEKSIGISYSVNNDNEKRICKGEDIFQNIVETNVECVHETVIEKLVFSQHWRLQLFELNNNTIVMNVPERKLGAYIILSENGEADLVDDIKDQVVMLKKDKAWNPRAKFTILLTRNYEGRHLKNLLAEAIFTELWKLKIVNIILLIHSFNFPADDMDINIYSWFPYDPPGRCGDIREAVLLDRCIIEGNYVYFSENATLFPSKSRKDLHGCPLRVSTFELGPMSLNKMDYEDGVYEFQDGIEVQLLKALAKSMNMSVLYMPRPDESLWGIELPNGTWTGITATANIWYKCHIVHELECLTSHILDPVKWFVPCAQPFPRWSSLTRVFKPSLWLGFVAAYIIVAYIMHLVVVLSAKLSAENPDNYAFHGKVKVFLNFWAVILEESASNNPPNKFSIRAVFLAWVLYCWAVNNVYQTFLTSFLVDPGLEHQISSEDELLTSREVRYGFDADTLAVISGLADDRYKHRIICTTFQDCRVRLVTTNRFAFAFGRVTTEYETAAKYMDGNGNPLICQFDAVIANQLTSMTVRKGYPLLNFFNIIIRRVLEAGLIEKWFDDIKYTATLISARDFNLPPGEYIKLSLEHLQSAFYFLFLGFVLSLISFITELFTRGKENCYRCKNK